MPDIAMCVLDDCPLAKTCFRNQARPSEYQLYGKFHYVPSEHCGGTYCEHYYPIGKNKEYK